MHPSACHQEINLWTWAENLPNANQFQCGLRQEERKSWFFLECLADVGPAKAQLERPTKYASHRSAPEIPPTIQLESATPGPRPSLLVCLTPEAPSSQPTPTGFPPQKQESVQICPQVPGGELGGPFIESMHILPSSLTGFHGTITRPPRKKGSSLTLGYNWPVTQGGRKEALVRPGEDA